MDSQRQLTYDSRQETAKPAIVDLEASVSFLRTLDKDVHYTVPTHFGGSQYHYFPLTLAQALPEQTPTIDAGELERICTIAKTDGFVVRKLQQQYGDVGTEHTRRGYEVGQLTGTGYTPLLRFLTDQVTASVEGVEEVFASRHNRQNLQRLLKRFGQHADVDLTDGVPYS